jgi:hypothetical protein
MARKIKHSARDGRAKETKDAKEPSALKRTNFFLAESSLENLELCAVRERRSAAAIVRDAVDGYLTKKGFTPTAFPTGFAVSYQ